jgi:hypothetical protein
MKDRMAAAWSAEDREQVSRNYEKLIAALVSMAKEEARIEFENRMASISFLTDQSGVGDFEANVRSTGLDLVKARIALELEVLGYYLEGKPEGENTKMLAWFYPPEETAAYRFKEVLEELNGLFNQNGDKGFDELEALLNAAADESEEKHFFLNGGSFITPHAGVIESLLGDFAAAVKQSEGLLAAYMRSGFFLTGDNSFESTIKRFVNSLENTFEMISPENSEEFRSWKDGLVSMLLEEAEAGEIQKRLDDLRGETLKYLDDPLLEWQGKPVMPDIQPVSDEYSLLIISIQNHLYNKEYLKKKLKNLNKVSNY